jgi:hypothetical protein
MSTPKVVRGISFWFVPDDVANTIRDAHIKLELQNCEGGGRGSPTFGK